MNIFQSEADICRAMAAFQKTTNDCAGRFLDDSRISVFSKLTKVYIKIFKEILQKSVLLPNRCSLHHLRHTFCYIVDNRNRNRDPITEKTVKEGCFLCL